MTSPDVRPISTDHLELFSSVNVYPSLDHQVLPQVGPTRNSRTLRQPSPYSSPDAGSRRALFVRSGCSPDSKSDSDDSDAELSLDVGPDSSPWRPADRCISAYASDESITAKTPPRQSNRPVHAYASDESITAKTPLRQSSRPVFAYDSDENSGRGNQSNKKDASGSKISGKQSATRSFPNVDESDSSNDDSDYIDKPPGEAGRPGRGGYTLRNSVTWTDRKYAKVKQFIDDLVEEKLECKLAFGNQSLKNIQDIKNRTIDRFPFLNKYRDLWIVNDFIKAHLKVRKAALKKQELEKIAADTAKKNNK